MSDRGNQTKLKAIFGAEVPSRALIVYVLLGVIGFGLLAYQTRFGPGTGGDSTSYLMGADNLLAGNGFSRYSGGYEIRAITGFPPFYSMVLAAFHGLGIPLMAAARWLNAILFASNLLLVSLLVLKRSGSLLAGALGSLLFLAADQLFYWHSWVMSEPLFILLMLLGISALLSYFSKPRRVMVLAAGVLFALATLTRYAGISLFAAAVLILLFVDRQSWKCRLIDTGVLLLVGAGIIGAWLLRNASAAGTAVNRSLIFHGVDRELLRLYLAEVSSWFVPHEVPLPTAARAILAVAILVLILGWFTRWAVRTRMFRWRSLLIEPKSHRLSALPWFLLIFMLAYGGVLAINSLLLDASTSPSAVPRYLVPLHTVLLVFSVSELARLTRQLAIPWIRILALVYAGGLILLYGANSSAFIREPLPHLGYTGDRIQWPELVSALELFDPQQPILSNNPELIYILAGRPAYVRPIRFDHYQEQFRQDYEEQLRAAERRLDEGAVLVIFKPVEQVDEAIIEYADLTTLRDFERALIYGHEDVLP